MRISRKSSFVATAATVLLCASVAGGVGTIVTTCAVIDAGTATNQGIVTIDECAPPATPPPKPSLGVLTTQGAIDGPLPAKPSTGDGSLGAVSLASSQTLPGGTYNYTDLDITGGATISYSGPVTILATGSVNVAGIIDMNVAGDLAIVAGDEIKILSMDGAPVTGVFHFSVGNVRLEADRVEIGVELVAPVTSATPNVAEVRSNQGDTVIRSHGSDPGNHAIDIADSSINVADGGNILMQSSTRIDVFTSLIDTSFGSVTVQAFGDDVRYSGSESYSRDGDTIVESSNDVTLQNATIVEAIHGELRIEAFDGDVTFDEAAASADDGVAVGNGSGTGSIIVAAAEFVDLNNDSFITSDGTGGVRVTAHGGDVVLERSGSTGQSYIECVRRGDVLVEASENVRLYGSSYLRTPRDIRAVAFGGEVLLQGQPFIDGSEVLVGASNAIVAQQDGPPPLIRGAGVDLVAGSGGINLQASVMADDGDFDLSMICDGDIFLEGSAEGSGGASVSLTSVDGDILVIDAMVTTLSGVGARSGSVRLRSFGGSGALIDATNATITSGDASFSSGDVSLLIHGGGTIQSFVLPKTVKVKINENRPEKSKVNAAGFFDTGPALASLAGPATVKVGDLEYTANLEPSKNGKSFLFKSGGARLQIKPNRSGSSRAKFKLTITDDLMGDVPDEGNITLEFETASANGMGTVELERGKYKLGKRRGLLSEPNVFPFKVKQVHKGDGKDVLSILAGLATGGGTPDNAPDVTISLGGVFQATVPGDEFTRKGDVYIAKHPPSAPGVSKLQINFLREQVSLKAKGLTLGARPDEGPYNIEVTVDNETRGVDIRMSPSNARTIKY